MPAGVTGGTPLVLIVNHSPQIVLLLDQIVSDLGFESAVLANDSDWRTEGYAALLAYIDERAPSAVLFDVPPPYEESARVVCRLIHESHLAAGQWVAISTGSAALHLIADQTGAAVIEKPFDLDELASLLQRAVDQSPTVTGAGAAD